MVCKIGAEFISIYSYYWDCIDFEVGVERIIWDIKNPTCLTILI